jgi:hypothetical protein
MSLINKKSIKTFIKEHGKYITQIEGAFYSMLETKIEKMILNAIANNASRKRLTQYELLGNEIKKKGGESN